MNQPPDTPDTTGIKVSTASGVPGLDDILGGGLTPRRLYLIEAVPGSGKTTLALQFLLEGARLGEPVLYITLSESEEEIRAVAASHGWTLEGIIIREIIPSEQSLNPDKQYTMFHPSDVELNKTTRAVLADIEKLKPRRVVLDSLSELRLLSASALQFRHQILALKQFFASQACTVLLLDEMITSPDLQVHSISHGVIMLEQLSPDYGTDRRRLRILKYRGHQFRGGYHDYVIRKGGVQVYPRLVAAEYRRINARENLQSGIIDLDALLGGGLERGSSTLIVGAAGIGKSSLAAQFACAAARRGQHAAFFIFDESVDTLLARASGLGIDLQKYVDSGYITIQPIDPAELTPGELAHHIREAVEEHDVSVIVIDSLNGYLNAMPGERFLTIQLHELLMYLGHKGVVSLLIGAHHGLIGTALQTPVDASYLADTIILMRYFETGGEIRQAISVMKKRGSRHERAVREFRMSNGRLEIGDTLSDFRGVLSGMAVFESVPDSPVPYSH